MLWVPKNSTVRCIRILVEVGVGVVPLCLTLAFGQQITVRNPSSPPAEASTDKAALAARGKDLQRRSLELQQKNYELEAKIHTKQAEYAQRTGEQLVDLLKNIGGCLRNPKECRKPPSPEDVLKTVKDQLKNQVTPLLNDLLDLNTDVNEQVAQRLRLEHDQRAYQRDLDKAYKDRSPAEPPDPDPPPPPPPPLPPPVRTMTDSELAKARDDIEVWCWETKGDRCFDGDPDAFRDFLSRHPDAKKHNEAAYRAPDDGLDEVTPDDAKTTSSIGTGGANCNGGLRDFTGLQRRAANGKLPDEAKTKTDIEFSDCKPKDKNEIPKGWIPCTCPAAHPGLGAFFEGVQYHDPSFFCPKKD